jgi:16S rRNA (uracil1498-N3)-methyltransferase
VADPAGRPLLPSLHTLLIGPEGGWSDDERDRFARRNTALVSFGPSVLRAETAAVTAGVLMTALRGGLVRPVPD